MEILTIIFTSSAVTAVITGIFSLLKSSREKEILTAQQNILKQQQTAADAIKDDAERNALLLWACETTLRSLSEKGADGEIERCITAIDKYKNRKAAV